MGSIKDILLSFISNGKNQLLLAGASIIVLLFLLNRWNYNRFVTAENKADRAQANLIAARDTIRISKAKDNSVEYNKYAYLVSDNKELKALNADLAKQVEITKGNVVAIQKLGVKVIHDSIPIPTTVYVQDSIVTLRSHLNTVYSPGNYRGLSFESIYNEREGKAHSTILGDTINFTATVGIKQNDKKQYEIFVRPDYPGMEVGQLNGAILEQNLFSSKTKTKTPIVSIGGNVGWVPLTYDISKQQTSVNLNRIGINLGLTFNIGAIFK